MIENAKEQLLTFFSNLKQTAIKNPWLFVLSVALSFWLTYVLAITHKANRLGFGAKSLWDWMDLLIVPIVIALGGLLFNLTQRKTELEIAERNRREDRSLAAKRANLERQLAKEKEQTVILDKYFDRMSNLLLDFELRKSNRQEEVRVLARARTLSTLLSLDGKRKGQILHFLVEAKLVKVDDSIVYLEGANFSGAEIGEVLWGGLMLNHANLSAAKFSKSRFQGVHFHQADISGASLEGCHFKDCDLESVNLKGANLRNAYLRQANLRSANLSSANLVNADLSEATLEGYNPYDGRVALLRDANLYGANLEKASLLSTDLSGANLDQTLLKDAQYDEFTIWPKDFDPIGAGAILIGGSS